MKRTFFAYSTFIVFSFSLYLGMFLISEIRIVSQPVMYKRKMVMVTLTV